ncbi:ZIP family metal transporter [Nanoarchaeota archaeon]
MSEIWLYSILSVIVVSLVSLIGIFTLSIRLKKLKKIIFFFVSFSVGALLGGAFIHLLPEAVEENGFGLATSFSILAGIIVFFVIEKFIHWRHCHVPTSKSHPHPFALMNLVGDSLHNFIDGIIIAGSYLANVQVGIATTIAVLLHEIPQEIGDFSVLIHGGFSRKKALLMNFLTGLTAVLGAVIVLILGSIFDGILIYIVPFTAGGFVYIAGSDLIPELHKETCSTKSTGQFLGIILGIAVMFLLRIVFG